jgi:hypothetical protein
MMRRILTSNIAKESGMVIATLFIIMLSYSVVFSIMGWALRYRWLFPFIMIPLIWYLVFLGRQDLKSPEAFPLRKGIAIFIMMILTTAIGFGALSLWMTTIGWAHYAPDKLDLFSYTNYYLWLFLEMIPLLKVNETLGLVAPLQSVGFVAGLPVLAFRALILFALLKSLKEWWSIRNEKNASSTKSQNPT